MENNNYKNITLNKHNLYYVHKKYSYIKISLDELKKLSSSKYNEITFMKCNNDLNNNKISSTVLETISFTVQEILTSNDWNIVYIQPQEEKNLLKEELKFLLEERKEVTNYIYAKTLDKIIEQLINKLNEYELFEKKINKEEFDE